MEFKIFKLCLINTNFKYYKTRILILSPIYGENSEEL